MARLLTNPSFRRCSSRDSIFINRRGSLRRFRCSNVRVSLNRQTTSQISCSGLTCCAPAKPPRQCPTLKWPRAPGLKRKLLKTISAKPTRALATMPRPQRPIKRRCSAAAIQKKRLRHGRGMRWTDSGRWARACAHPSPESPRFAVCSRLRQSPRPHWLARSRFPR